MYSRILLIALLADDFCLRPVLRERGLLSLGLLLYRPLRVARYYRYDRYYVAPQPRYYYQPAPRYYYRSAPAPQYRPYPQPGVNQWHGNPRYDYGNRNRQDYRQDRDRHDYRDGSQRYQHGDWHSNGQGNDGGRRDGRPGQGRGGNWQR